jgi:regulator of chromosome condensation
LGFSVDSNIQQTPVLIKGLKNIVDVACGNDHALALDKNGKVWAWGTSQQDQLGRLGLVLGRDRTKGLIPQKIELTRKKVKSIHSGSFHSFAVTTDGSVYSWGLNSFGQCGFYVEPKDDSTRSLVSVPTRAPALQDQDIVMLDGGDKHSIALTSDGDLLAWGIMTAHQVGVGLDKVPSESVILDESGKPLCLLVPSKISDKKFKSVASGANHNIAIDVDGAAHSWGFGDQYQCGQGEPGQDVKEPCKVVNTATSGVDMVAAACGGSVTVLAGFPAKR